MQTQFEKPVFCNVGNVARAISALPSNDPTGEAVNERSRFLVGTQGFQQDNEIHLVELDEEEWKAVSIAYRHPCEIWHIAACPKKIGLISTCYNTTTPQNLEESMKGSLWTMDQTEVPYKTTGGIRDLSKVWDLPVDKPKQ